MSASRGLARGAAVCALALAATMLPAAACADPLPQMFVGGQAGFSQFAYVGGSVPVINGFGVRLSGFGGRYAYQGGPTGRVNGTFGGAQIEALYQYVGKTTWLNVGIGVSDIDTRLSPVDLGNRRLGNHAEPLFSLDGGHVDGPWRVDGYASYGTQLEDYSARASLTHALSGRWRLGVEGSLEGDPTYNEQRIGPLAALQINPKSEFLLAGGLDHQAGRGDGGFVRLAFNHTF
jgi:Cellulose biosynthesis protein BcsS